VFKIDDTIIDQFENELDHKNGKLITLGNETINGLNEGNSNSVLSSTRLMYPSSSSSQNKNTKKPAENLKRNPSKNCLNTIKESSSDDDQFENCNILLFSLSTYTTYKFSCSRIEFLLKIKYFIRDKQTWLQ
jgi:hypothetical protein